MNNIKIFNFMKYKYLFGILSLFLIIISIYNITIKQLNYGVDFAGGTLIQIKYNNNNIQIEKIRKKLKEEKEFKSVSVTKFGNNNEFIIKMQLTNSNLKNKINKKLKKVLKDTGLFEIRRVDMVGPKVGAELKEKGIKATIFALIGILIYIIIRYELIFSVSSVIPLFHDVIITLGFISILNIEINLDVLAAILTIIGYSLNDTIIIFDRIKETIITQVKEKELNKIINYAISSTLTRTLITSLTTFFVIFTLYIYGGEIIKPFAITLLIGIIVGTYSSIYIASSSLIFLKFDILQYRKKIEQKKKKEKEKEQLRTKYANGIL